MSELLKRSLTGLGFAAIMLAGIVSHPISFAIVFATFLGISLLEFYRMAENLDIQPQKTVGIISAILFFLIFFLAANRFIAGKFIFFAMLIPLLTFLCELFGKSQHSFRNSAATVFGLVYIALPFSLLNYIIIPGESGFYPWILVGIFLIIWAYDSMAYLAGSNFGRHKIFAKISPGKSWEGLFGGFIFAVIVGILNAVIFPGLTLLNWVAIALLVVVFGTFGDFFESKIKRETGVKDSGNILPGHGGMLDRFDSLLFAVPVIFIWLNLFGNF